MILFLQLRYTPKEMKLVPSTKIDLEACANLRTATDNEVTPFVSDLLEWLKDLNWPGAPRQVMRVKWNCRYAQLIAIQLAIAGDLISTDTNAVSRKL